MFSQMEQKALFDDRNVSENCWACLINCADSLYCASISSHRKAIKTKTEEYKLMRQSDGRNKKKEINSCKYLKQSHRNADGYFNIGANEMDSAPEIWALEIFHEQFFTGEKKNPVFLCVMFDVCKKVMFRRSAVWLQKHRECDNPPLQTKKWRRQMWSRLNQWIETCAHFRAFSNPIIRFLPPLEFQFNLARFSIIL